VGWGEEGCSPPDSGKAIIFRAKAKFFGQKPAAKKEKNIFWDLLNEKNGSHFVLARKSAGNLGSLPIIIGWGESG